MSRRAAVSNRRRADLSLNPRAITARVRGAASTCCESRRGPLGERDGRAVYPQRDGERARVQAKPLREARDEVGDAARLQGVDDVDVGRLELVERRDPAGDEEHVLQPVAVLEQVLPAAPFQLRRPVLWGQPETMDRMAGRVLVEQIRPAMMAHVQIRRELAEIAPSVVVAPYDTHASLRSQRLPGLEPVGVHREVWELPFGRLQEPLERLGKSLGPGVSGKKSWRAPSCSASRRAMKASLFSSCSDASNPQVTHPGLAPA